MEKKIETLKKFHEGEINSYNVAKEFGVEDSDKLDAILDKYDADMDKEGADTDKVIAEYINKIDALSPTTSDAELKTEDKPKVRADENGTFHGIFLPPMNMERRIPQELTRMAETDEELAKAIADGKKTFKGCVRWLSNNMADLMREMRAQDITYNDESVHMMARYYMVNEDCLDVQNAVAKALPTPSATPSKSKDKGKKKGDTKKTDTPTKATDTKKTEDKKKGNKVVPLTPSIGSLFSDEDFE